MCALVGVGVAVGEDVPAVALAVAVAVGDLVGPCASRWLVSVGLRVAVGPGPCRPRVSDRGIWASKIQVGDAG